MKTAVLMTTLALGLLAAACETNAGSPEDVSPPNPLEAPSTASSESVLDGSADAVDRAGDDLIYRFANGAELRNDLSDMGPVGCDSDAAKILVADGQVLSMEKLLGVEPTNDPDYGINYGARLQDVSFDGTLAIVTSEVCESEGYGRAWVLTTSGSSIEAVEVEQVDGWVDSSSWRIDSQQGRTGSPTEVYVTGPAHIPGTGCDSYTVNFDGDEDCAAQLNTTIYELDIETGALTEVGPVLY